MENQCNVCIAKGISCFEKDGVRYVVDMFHMGKVKETTRVLKEFCPILIVYLDQQQAGKNQGSTSIQSE